MSRLRLSYSSIKDFTKTTPSLWKQKWIDFTTPREWKTHFTFGSLVDCLLLEPERFSQLFVVCELPEPTPKVLECIWSVVAESTITSNAMIEHQPAILQWIEDTKFQKGWKTQTALTFILVWAEYFEFCHVHKGKQVISPLTLREAKLCRDGVLTNPQTRPFVDHEWDKNTHLLFQQTIKESDPILNVQYKGKLDILQVREDWQRTVDLKTVGWCPSYAETVARYRYDWQVDFYNYLSDIWLTSNGIETNLLPPINLVVDKTSHQAFVYQFDRTDTAYARYGNEDNDGWKDVIERILWHHDTSQWEAPREEYTSTTTYETK